MLEELSDIKEEHKGFLRRRIILWVVRWIIGFAIVAVVVRHYPNLFWLWYVAGAIFLVTPITALLAQRFVAGKLGELEKNIENLNQQLAADTDEQANRQP
ncbi:hypothetical protein [Pseudomaricurvus sp. HS19]|uniref:hypothetical protein n=1 Tax=Pseudomaricurvus sp. HS19 TaxID=2692626 RepID=UPI0013709B4F|nr:hypothetical protein [Pseudomaricurvus sp. HS19]MYM64887.1 hypothetical protein [Pseudomaricurvus sp. HS19]